MVSAGIDTRRTYRYERWRKAQSTDPNLALFMTDAQERASDRSLLRPHCTTIRFFIIPAYDDAMQRLIFVSYRTGNPQIFAEERATGELRQLTDRPDLAESEWSVHPSHDGKAVFFTAGTSGWRLDLETLEERELVNFAATAMKDEGMVAAAMGTTALSHDDRWWAVKFNIGKESALAIIDTDTGEHDIILRRDSIAHLQFCPDDANLLYYAGAAYRPCVGNSPRRQRKPSPLCPKRRKE